MTASNNAPAMRSALSTASLLSSKSIPKRAVSFAKACKHDAPRKARPSAASDDGLVQSTDNRRRYQRRGSKTPAMLVLSRTDLASIQNRRHSINCDCCQCCSVPDPSVHTMVAATATSPREMQYARRMSGAASSSPSMCRFAAAASAAVGHVDYTPSVVAASSQRRMSLMTALKQNLERSLILDAPASTAAAVVVETIRRMSMDASNRSYTLELLSHS